MVRYASSLAFTYSPATARKQFDALSYPFFDLRLIHRRKQTFYELAGTIETAKREQRVLPGLQVHR